MKPTAFLTFIFLLLLGTSVSQAQPNQLYASYWNGSAEIFASLDLSTHGVTYLDSLSGVQFLSSGESTYDPVNSRYINVTNLGVTVIDALSGNILNSFPGTGNLKGIEFDPVSGRLYGSYWTGSVEMFAWMDLATGTLTDIDTLVGVTGLSSGESTFDPDNGRYFRNTNLGFIAVDVQTASLLNVYPGASNLKGLEYDRASSRIYASYGTTTFDMFAYMDISTGSVLDIDTLKGVSATGAGESTFDPDNGRYFTLSTMGQVVIDIQTGNITDTLQTTLPLKLFEYPYTWCAGPGMPDPLAVSSSSICDGDSAMLSISPNYSNYQWSNGATTNAIYVADSMQYSVSYTDALGCVTTTSSVSVNVVDCSIFVDSSSFVVDTCLLDSIPIVQAYATNVTVSGNLVILDWVFITGTNDTLTASATYNLNQNGVYAISITVNCNGKRTSSLSFYDLIEIEGISPPLSIGGKFNESSFYIYPNPTNGNITLNADCFHRQVDVAIQSLEGKTMIQKSFQNLEKAELDVSVLPTGVYFLRIGYEGKSEILRLMKE